VFQLDFSPLCMCAAIVMDEVGEVVDEMLCFGDDQGMLHAYELATLNLLAERNM
jgi:hypothetical protein